MLKIVKLRTVIVKLWTVDSELCWMQEFFKPIITIFVFVLNYKPIITIFVFVLNSEFLVWPKIFILIYRIQKQISWLSSINLYLLSQLVQISLKVLEVWRKFWYFHQIVWSTWASLQLRGEIYVKAKPRWKFSLILGDAK